MTQENNSKDNTKPMLTEEMIAGGIRDFMLKRYQDYKKPWDGLNEAEQRSLSIELGERAKELVREAIRVTAAKGFPVLTAKLEQVTVKEGIKGVLQISQIDPERHTLIDAVGSHVMVICADKEEYYGEIVDAEITPDTPVLFDNSPAGKRVAAERADLQ
jgi:hypothetical protein